MCFPPPAPPSTSTPASLCRGTIRKPVETSDRAYQGCRYGAIAGPGARHHIAFSCSGRKECQIATAVERRIGQRNAWLGVRAEHRDRPPPLLLQRRLSGKK